MSIVMKQYNNSLFKRYYELKNETDCWGIYQNKAAIVLLKKYNIII